MLRVKNNVIQLRIKPISLALFLFLSYRRCVAPPAMRPRGPGPRTRPLFYHGGESIPDATPFLPNRHGESPRRGLHILKPNSPASPPAPSSSRSPRTTTPSPLDDDDALNRAESRNKFVTVANPPVPPATSIILTPPPSAFTRRRRISEPGLYGLHHQQLRHFVEISGERVPLVSQSSPVPDQSQAPVLAGLFTPAARRTTSYPAHPSPALPASRP